MTIYECTGSALLQIDELFISTHFALIGVTFSSGENVLIVNQQMKPIMSIMG